MFCEKEACLRACACARHIPLSSVLVAICLKHRALCLSLSLLLHRMLTSSCSSITCVFSLPLSLPHPLSLCLSVFTKGRGLTFTSAHVRVRAHVDGPGFHPPTQWTTLCVIRALVPTLAFSPLHVCFRQRDWAVSISWHMQQDTDISEAPPHQGAQLPLSHSVHV